MCGIVGIVNKDSSKNCDETALVAMRDLLAHRGPDDKGLFIDRNIGLGHRRLSIIDLGGGHQPMTNEDKTLWIVYNGEIYNFKEIRDELIQKGHVFRTNSDTEVILHLYEEKGMSCVEYLNGMFSFAIWNKRSQTLFLARDRMGIKPLYYADTNETFLFASEIKSIVKGGLIKAECNNEAVFEYFLFRHISGENSLFKGIKSLLPGHTLLLKDHKIKINQYWSYYEAQQRCNLDFREASEKLFDLLQDAIKIRLMSDVPLGTFCSGGLDSSLVTAIAANIVNHPINTFSVGFHEEEWDESKYAKIVSDKNGTRHHVVHLNNAEFSSLLPQMIWHNDEPLNFANSVQIYAISKLAKKHVTVVLTGEGSDELFGGYPRYLIPKLIERYRKLPAPFQHLMYSGLSLVKDHRFEKLKMYMRYSMNDMLIYNSSYLKQDFIADILADKWKLDLENRKSAVLKGQKLGMDPVTNLSILDQQNYLVSILNRQDKMSMAAAIESRVPFLDHRIVEFANSLPVNYKMRLFQTKRVVKTIAEQFLPNEIIHRKKSGFGVPLTQWFRDAKGLGNCVYNLLADSCLYDFISKSQLENCISEHNNMTKDHTEILWSLINLQVWKNTFNVQFR